MPFRNSVVAAVLATATAGSRIVIDGTGTFANLIQFWTGRSAETTPAVLRHDFIAFTSLYSMSMRSAVVTPPGNTPAELTLSTKETTGVTSADLKADTSTFTQRGFTSVPRIGDVNSRFNVTADTVQFNGFTTNSPKLYLDGFGLLDVLGAWKAYTPAITGSGSNPTIGNSSVVAWYMQIGKTVIVNFSITTGTTWVTGAGNYSVSLPVAAAHGSILAGLGNIILVNSGGTFIGTCFAQGAVMNGIYNSFPGTYVNAGAMPSGAGSAYYMSLTYEAA